MRKLNARIIFGMLERMENKTPAQMSSDMRKIYIEIIKLIATYAKKLNEDVDLSLDIGQLLICIDHESSPPRDQDLTDFLAEFYIFVVFGYEPDMPSDSETIKDWDDFYRRLRVLEASDEHVTK